MELPKINPMDLTTEMKSLPKLLKAKYLLIGINPLSKTRTQEEPEGDKTKGLELRFIMTEYSDLDGNNVKTVVASKTETGLSIQFPEGKTGLIARMYKTPKMQIKVAQEQDGKKSWRAFPVEMLEKPNFIKVLRENNPEEFEGLSEFEVDQAFKEFCIDAYYMGLKQDLALKQTDKLEVGLSQWYYRNVTENTKAENDDYKWNTNITRYIPRKIDQSVPVAQIEKAGWEKELTDEHKIVSSDFAYAIAREYDKKDEQNGNDSNSDDKPPF